MYLFDTDTITNVLKKIPSPFLLRHMARIHPGDQFISTITVSEVVYGARKSERPEYHLNNLKTLLLPEVAVLDFDLNAAYVAGQIRAQLEKAGTPLAWADIQIAAVAIANEKILVTGNSAHFKKIAGLDIENWLIG